MVLEVRAMSSGDVGVQYRAVFYPTENQLTLFSSRMDGKIFSDEGFVGDIGVVSGIYSGP